MTHFRYPYGNQCSENVGDTPKVMIITCIIFFYYSLEIKELSSKKSSILLAILLATPTPPM
jgi:hypothetical protein